MKPFDIEKAKQGHPVQTRDGHVKSRKKEAWVNIYYNLYYLDHVTGGLYYSKEEAIRKSLSDRIDTVKIEWEK